MLPSQKYNHQSVKFSKVFSDIMYNKQPPRDNTLAQKNVSRTVFKLNYDNTAPDVQEHSVGVASENIKHTIAEGYTILPPSFVPLAVHKVPEVISTIKPIDSTILAAMNKSSLENLAVQRPVQKSNVLVGDLSDKNKATSNAAANKNKVSKVKLHNVKIGKNVNVE